MAFTGKATYSAGASLPEIAEDVADIIGIVSPHETPLLDHLGDPRTESRSTVHEWLEDSLTPNYGFLDQSAFSPSPTAATGLIVEDSAPFRVGDQIRAEGSAEVMLITTIAPGGLVVVRGYGGTTAEPLADNLKVHILGNAALEGDDAPAVRVSSRVRKSNYTQIFSSTVEVSGSQRAATTIGVEDELEYQKQERIRELLRDLENCLINGVAAATTPQGDATTRRTMSGIINAISTNLMTPGAAGIPDGDGAAADVLNEAVLNAALRTVWEGSSAPIDTIVVNGAQKRRINSFASQLRGFQPGDTRFTDLISTYESDFGVCRVVLSRWMPADSVLLLDATRINVLPMAGRSFHFKPLGTTGDRDAGVVLGEYTAEIMNENAHGIIRGLATT